MRRQGVLPIWPASAVAARLGRFLRRAGRDIRWFRLGTPPAVLISGPPRVGKSTVAKEVARRTGFQRINTDRIRTEYAHVDDRQAWEQELRGFLAAKLANRRRGLVIEGVHLIKRAGNGSDGLDLLSELADRYGASVFLVGCTAGIDRKAAAVRQHERPGSYTSVWSDDELLRRVGRISRRSRSLLQSAEPRAFEYLEIGPDNFQGDIEAAVERILLALQGGGRGVRDTALGPAKGQRP